MPHAVVRVVRTLLAILSLGAMLSCDSPTERERREPAAMLLISGDEQEGTVGTELPDPLVARVVDAAGNPIEGQLVNFRVVSGGGSMFAGSGLTNQAGIVQDRWTLGTSTSQEQQVEARAVDAQTGAPLVFATFTAVPLPGAPATVAKHAGDGQEGAVGAPVPIAPAVRVMDAHGNGVPGITVSFEAVTEGSSVARASVETNDEGIAAAQSWTLAPATGENALVATVEGITPVRFTAKGRAGAPRELRKLAGDEQMAGTGTNVPVAPRVVVVDEHGNIVQQAGAVVTFTVSGGGGGVAVAAAETDASGEATPGNWTLGTTAGPQALDASLAGGAAVTFSAVAVPRDTLVTKVSGDQQSGDPSHSLPQPIVVRVADRYGNPVGGHTVSWMVAASDAAVAPQNPLECAAPERPCHMAYSTTDADGRAEAQWTIGSGAFPRNPGSGEIESLYVSAFRTGLGDRSVTFTASLKLFRASELYSGERHACAISSEGTLYCWGENDAGQLGNGNTESAATPVRATAVTQRFVKISLGARHTCGVTEGREAWCWGDNTSGQLGNGTAGGAQLTPTRVAGDIRFDDIAAGGRHTCGITREPSQYYPHWTGNTYCWGANDKLQVGAETTDACTTGPCAVTPQDRDVPFAPAAIFAGGEHSCLIIGQTQRHETWCWGANEHGQLGYGISNTPLQALRLGRAFSCAVGWGGSGPSCWGENTYGQVGNGTTTDVRSPAYVQNESPLSNKLGTGIGDHACMINNRSQVLCWGWGAHGQMGNGRTDAINTRPQAVVAASLSFTHIGAGLTHSCARASTGAIYCWGSGPAIGQGSLDAQRLYPAPIAARRD